MSVSSAVSFSSGRSSSNNFSASFWQLWQQYQDDLYRCCIKWMGGNPIDAEDALSRAMLKAWEKVQKNAGEINNFQAWLKRLTHNLCIDIYRERSWGANRVEDIEGYTSSEELGLVSFEETPESALEAGEKRIVIRRAIDNLPTRLRETFILHFYQELSYPEIAQQQDISYQNVCKRISQARKILQEELKGYFILEEGTDTDKSVPPTANDSEIGEISEGNEIIEPRSGEKGLAVAVEEVESVEHEEVQEVGRDVQQSELVIVAATSERCIEAALYERQFAAILVLAQFDETGSWGNSCLAEQRQQQQDQVRKVAEEFVRAISSPPWYRLFDCQALVKAPPENKMLQKSISEIVSRMWNNKKPPNKIHNLEVFTMKMSQIKKNLSSLLQSAVCACLIVSVVFGFASQAFALDVKAGPIWNNDDAKIKCPVAAQVYDAKWNGQWTTTVPGAMSVCGTDLSFLPTVGLPGDVKAGPIWNNDDAKVKCPVAAAAANGVWNGQWTTTVPGAMSVCGVKVS